ncbi:MAG: putative transposase [Roseivirga sp.]|jgi:putative transposase
MKSKELEGDYAHTCFHYIHQNPLKSRLTDGLEGWEFSSFKDYCGLRDGQLPSKTLPYELIDIPINPEEFYAESIGVINSERIDKIL